MRRIKTISAFLVVILCFSALCTGVYSTSYISAQITGELSIIPIKLKNSIEIQNSSNIDAVIDCSVENAVGGSSTTINKNGVWNSGIISFSKEIFCEQYRLQTIKIKMLITNKSDSPISANIREGETNLVQNTAAIKVTTLGSPYIAPGRTEETSVQFSAVFSRWSGAPVIPEIVTYSYIVSLNSVQTISPIIKYDTDLSSTAMPAKGFCYYLEFGDNPFYKETSASTQREKLRWYIWAKADENGRATALESGVDYNSSTKEFIGDGSKYFFISEYVLPTQAGSCEVSFQNESEEFGSSTPSGRNSADYAESNCRNYINGLTVKNSYYMTENWDVLSEGANINFFEYYKLTDDEILGLIEKRELNELYNEGSNNNLNEIPSEFAEELDKFWLLSYDEFHNFIQRGTTNNGVAYSLYGSAYRWWLRSPKYETYEYYIYDDGVCRWEEVFADDDYIGVRPAFALSI